MQNLHGRSSPTGCHVTLTGPFRLFFLDIFIVLQTNSFCEREIIALCIPTGILVGPRNFRRGHLNLKKRNNYFCTVLTKICISNFVKASMYLLNSLVCVFLFLFIYIQSFLKLFINLASIKFSHLYVKI